MTLFHETITFNTKFEGELILLDDKINSSIAKSNINNGQVTIFVPGSTGAVSTIEFEEGLKKDFPNILNKIVPSNFSWNHNQLNFDDNGHSHIRASIIGPSLTIPFVNKNMTLGTWQQVIFIELDTHARTRHLEIMIIGEQ